MKLRNVLSLFDGMACGRIALERANIDFDNYYASEIDKHCIAVAKDNFSDIKHLGDVNNWREWDIQEIDLIMGGSPCQGFANQGKRLNFDDSRSKLFFTFVEILNHFQPKYFILENVIMNKKEWTAIINEYMGIEPVRINSNLVSAQNRPRYYWTNFEISQPADKKIVLSDILERDNDWRPTSIVGRKINPKTMKREDSNPDVPYTQCLQVKKDKSKAGCLTTVQKDSCISKLEAGRYFDCFNNYTQGVDWRYFTPIEYERLQTLPDGYTKAVSDNQRFKMMGNGWTVDVITHILNEMKGV